MREMVEKEIDGKTYSITQFTTKKSLKVLARLVGYCGEPVAMFMALSTESAKEMGPEKEAEIIQKAVKILCDKMKDEDGVIDLVEILSSGDTLLCDGKKVSFDIHYQGNLKHLFKVLVAVIEVQYANFLEEMVSKGGVNLSALGKM